MNKVDAREAASLFPMRQVQRCESTEPYFVQLIRSGSQEDLVYEVHSLMPDDPSEEYVCGCPAFRFNGKCKHQEMAWYDRCLWDETIPNEPEEQDEEQKAKQICPRCGQKTVKDEFLD